MARKSKTVLHHFRDAGRFHYRAASVPSTKHAPPAAAPFQIRLVQKNSLERKRIASFFLDNPFAKCYNNCRKRIGNLLLNVPDALVRRRSSVILSQQYCIQVVDNVNANQFLAQSPVSCAR